ncbi:uncharacterized protein LOC144115454 [Amblyomma americanum]
MTGNYSFEGLRRKRPMVCVCVSLLLALAVASAAATPRQTPEEPKLELLDSEIETTTDEDGEFIEGRIVGGKPVSVLRKREHGGAATSKTSGGSGSSGAGAQKPRGNSASSAAPGSGAQRPSAAGRPHPGDRLKLDSSSWKPSLSGSSAGSGNSRPSFSSGNQPSSSPPTGGSSFNRPRPGDYGQASQGSNPTHGTNGFENEHRGGMPNQSPDNGGSVPWNHQGVSPGYSAYPAPVTSAYTDDEPSGYSPNLVPTPNILTPSNEPPPSHPSNPTNSPGGLRGGIVIGHPPGNSFSQPDSGVNRPSVHGDDNGPRLEGGLIIGSPPTNSLGVQSGGFNNHPPPQDIDLARRGVVGPQHPQQGAGSFGLPSIPSNPFAPANPGFQGPGSLPLPFGAGLFNPGLMNIQKAVEHAAAGVLGPTGAGPNPGAASVFGRTSTFGQMSSFGFTDRK